MKMAEEDATLIKKEDIKIIFADIGTASQNEHSGI